MEKFIIMPMFYVFAVLAMYQLVITWKKWFNYVMRKINRQKMLKIA
jgi:hypothetical protein